MAAPALPSLLAFLVEKEFLTREQLEELAQEGQVREAAALLRELVRRGWITSFQANQIADGNGKELVLGSYRLLEPIGEGGMGQVFKARHVRMDRIVALKFIPKELLSNPQAVARFYREVRAVAQLSHPNIVTAYEVNQEGYTHYFAMEFMEGIDLSRLVRQSGPLTIPQACDYIRQAALGLQHAHEKGMVHRDIKPGNLIVGRATAGGSPVVKVLDFGLARFEIQDRQVTRLTKVGHVIGTVDYLSPEQAGDAREVDIRADIYSLGCSLFYLLTAKPPFEGAGAAERMIARVVNDAPSVRTLRPDAPPVLEKVLAKMLARNRGERYQTPAEVVAALEPFSQLAEVQPWPATAVQSPPPPNITSKPAVNMWRSFADEEIVVGKRGKPGRRLSKSYLAGICLAVFALIGAGFFLGRKTHDKAPLGLDKNPVEKPADATQPAVQLASKPQNSFANCIGMNLAFIPAGEFLMGSPKNESQRVDHEGPQHKVKISRPFYIGIYEVSQGQYQRVMRKNPAYAKDGVDHPVENVTWHDATEFCKKLSALPEEKKRGRIYELPTEAEWEYACRAGTRGPFCFGQSLTLDQANFNGNEPYGGENGPGVGKPIKIGSYLPNPWGLHDMHGNVWEWCLDGPRKYENSNQEVTDPIGPRNPASPRVIRGGAFNHFPRDARSAFRMSYPPSHRGYSLGFRVALRQFANEIRP